MPGLPRKCIVVGIYTRESSMNEFDESEERRENRIYAKLMHDSIPDISLSDCLILVRAGYTINDVIDVLHVDE